MIIFKKVFLILNLCMFLHISTASSMKWERSCVTLGDIEKQIHGFQVKYKEQTRSVYVFAFTKEDFLKVYAYGKSGKLFLNNYNIPIQAYYWVEIDRNKLEKGVKSCIWA